MTIYRMTVGLQYASGGSPGVNVWHRRITGINEPASLAAARSSLAFFYASINELFHTGTTITVCEDVVKITPSDPPGGPDIVEDAPGVPSSFVYGQSTAGEAPAPLAFCCSWRTSSRSRSGMGRTFIGPLASTVMDADGTPANAKTAVLRTAALALIAAGAGPEGTGAFGVYSRKEGVIRDFTGVSVSDSRYAVLRSRQD